MKNWFNHILLSICLILAHTSYGQNQDLYSWYNIGAKYKINKKLSLSASYENRFTDNGTAIQYKFADASVKYKFNKLVSLGVGMRTGKQKDWRLPFVNVLRFHGQITFSKKVVFLKIRARFRYQYKEKEDVFEGEPTNYTNSIRQQIKISTKLKPLKLKPFVAFEFFQRSKRKNGKNEDLEISKNRFTTGVEFKPWKHHSFDLFWGYEREYNRSIYWKYFITGVGYTFNF